MGHDKQEALHDYRINQPASHKNKTVTKLGRGRKWKIFVFCFPELNIDVSGHGFKCWWLLKGLFTVRRDLVPFFFFF